MTSTEIGQWTEQRQDDDLRESQMMTRVVVMTCIFLPLWLAVAFVAIRYAG